MKANVMNKTSIHKLPAGIIDGTECFLYASEKMVISNGQIMKFSEAPGTIQRMIADEFMSDVTARKYISSKMGITGFTAAFDTWFKCRIGALDETPDFKDGNLTADAYNHACADNNCPHRGKLCSLTPGLKNYEVETLQAIKRGETIEQMSETLHTSVPGLKSRITRIREKLGANNMASMVAKAVEFGI